MRPDLEFCSFLLKFHVFLRFWLILVRLHVFTGFWSILVSICWSAGSDLQNPVFSDGPAARGPVRAPGGSGSGFLSILDGVLFRNLPGPGHVADFGVSDLFDVLPFKIVRILDFLKNRVLVRYPGPSKNIGDRRDNTFIRWAPPRAARSGWSEPATSSAGPDLPNPRSGCQRLDLGVRAGSGSHSGFGRRFI